MTDQPSFVIIGYRKLENQNKRPEAGICSRKKEKKEPTASPIVSHGRKIPPVFLSADARVLLGFECPAFKLKNRY
jgi:hypothetical protein